jgi:hypothetical protein
MNHKAQILIQRLPAGPHSESLKAAITGALDAADAFAARREELRRSGKFTDAGLREQLTADLQKSFAPKLNNARRPVRALRQRLDALRAEIRPATPDPQNIVEALKRQELRAHLFDLEKVGDRVRLATTRPEFAAAALDGPPELSGLPADVHGELMKTHLTALHSSKMAEAAEIEAALEAAEAGLQLAENDLRREFGNAPAFEKIVAGTRFKPWLKKYVENGQEVVRKFEWDPDALNGSGSGRWVLASPADITDGEYFPDSAAFYRANGIEEHRTDDFWRTTKAAA